MYCLDCLKLGCTRKAKHKFQDSNERIKQRKNNLRRKGDTQKYDKIRVMNSDVLICRIRYTVSLHY